MADSITVEEDVAGKEGRCFLAHVIKSLTHHGCSMLSPCPLVDKCRSMEREHDRCSRVRDQPFEI